MSDDQTSHLSFATTSDGSQTLFNAKVGEHYHSRHGALQESRHVFLESGLKYFLERNDTNKVSVLEAGFGTGLNFLVTADYTIPAQIKLEYTGIEAFPLSKQIISRTGYKQYVPENLWREFVNNYELSLTSRSGIDPLTQLEIVVTDLQDFSDSKKFDVLYFDAFAAIHQPEMWTHQSLSHITSFLKPGGVFVTYAITGDLKRTMKGLGFSIEKVAGAPGKREMLRAVNCRDA